MNPLAAASSRPSCFGDDSSRLSMSLRLKGEACAMSSGSSSDAYVVPGFASASPSLLMASRFGEQEYSPG